MIPDKPDLTIMYDHFTIENLKMYTFILTAILLIAQVFYLCVLGKIENRINDVFSDGGAFSTRFNKLKDHIKKMQFYNLIFNVLVCIVCVGSSHYLTK
ncbi:hypothetical protein RsoM2USA_294 [Ralstonia phage RsoM2USA]|nr:hypothetical protein RsoM2USA_294 [Ralstonia phage RsoM2USA]